MTDEDRAEVIEAIGHTQATAMFIGAAVAKALAKAGKVNLLDVAAEAEAMAADPTLAGTLPEGGLKNFAAFIRMLPLLEPGSGHA